MSVYAVDLALLDERIAQMTRFEASMERALGDLDEEMASLHGTWTGLAADAQARAHQEWTGGAREMREALVKLRQAAEVAHRNYTHAVRANTDMWNKVG